MWASQSRLQYPLVEGGPVSLGSIDKHKIQGWKQAYSGNLRNSHFRLQLLLLSESWGWMQARPGWAAKPIGINVVQA